MSRSGTAAIRFAAIIAMEPTTQPSEQSVAAPAVIAAIVVCRRRRRRRGSGFRARIATVIVAMEQGTQPREQAFVFTTRITSGVATCR